jgi:Tol biopolymer transport system component
MDGRRLFVSTSTSSIYGIDSSAGSTIWDVIGSSGFQSEPRVSPDDQRVYVAQSLDGQILSIDQQDGRVHWAISCDEFEADCSNSVLANFALSSSGQYLYYADVFGKIVALTLGNFVETTTNGNDGEGARQNSGGDFFGEQTPRGSSHSQTGSSRGTYIALVILGMVISFGIGVFMFLVRRERMSASRKTRASRSLVEQGSVYGFDDNNDFSPTEVLSMPNGFKDEMILYPTMCSQRDAFKEEYPEVYAQDCFPKPLRGSRRVAPFEEDYSFGAAVLV